MKEFNMAEKIKVITQICQAMLHAISEKVYVS